MPMKVGAFQAANQVVHKNQIYTRQLGRGSHRQAEFIDVNRDDAVNCNFSQRTGWTTFEDNYNEPQLSVPWSQLQKRTTPGEQTILTHEDLQDVKVLDRVRVSFGNTIYTETRVTHRGERPLENLATQMGYNIAGEPDPSGRLLGVNNKCAINLATGEFLIYTPK